MQGLQLNLKIPWMIVFYSITNGLTTSDVERICTANEARNTRVITICSLVKSEGWFQNFIDFLS